MKAALLIMAAGIGSRYGGGIKQLAVVDSRAHIIMDYSIHDAIAAGFQKIIFVIRREIEEDFRTVIGNRIEAVCARVGVEVCFAFQSLTDLPEGIEVPEGRHKPWGTGQAVLSARALIREPFAVINADDYYGKEAFHRLYDFLVQDVAQNRFCMAGFTLKNTLSDNGAVTRGICAVDSEDYLTNVVETGGIIKTASGVESEGEALDPNAVVSMNMWGFDSSFLETLEKGFRFFLEKHLPRNPEKAEFLIPVFVGRRLQAGQITVKVLRTSDKWFGVTYQEDKELVMEGIRQLIREGAYQQDLYADL